MATQTTPGIKTRTVKVDYLARVEGEGALHLRIKGGVVRDVRFSIFEPPRLFEAFLQGRSFQEAPDITARICGICPVAYQMSAAHAIENAFGIEIHPAVRLLRRLLYCGEWIESHVLHVFMLHAPDFLGKHDVLEMAAEHKDLVLKALEMKKVGNDIVSLLGGREIHPISVRIGGFSWVPRKQQVRAMVDRFQKALDTAVATTRILATLPFPEFEPDYEFVSLCHPAEYPFNEGRVKSSRGLDIPVSEFEDHFREQHVAHSNALQSVHLGHGSYHVGPLARFALNFQHLHPVAKQLAADIKLSAPCRNPFKSLLVRMVETAYAYEEAIRIAQEYEPPPEPAVKVKPRPGAGQALTEAPRGSLYHRYVLEADGLIRSAKIVPPTAQNQTRIEDDLRELAPTLLHLSDEDLTLRCEQAVRNYDPCISCATHFLRVTVERS
ncbi:MAG: Ni/Fe hydrogenase subunit alpha [Bryobacterales bacterium]|jgi:coenzyme F420-reducing hydrogenase alpha subunit|nr:Ni/Fe hydrogenase subunit alpha [Bryobacterales bacterium]